MLLELGHEACAAARVGVTAVHEAVYIYILEAVFLGHIEELEIMLEGAVDSAAGAEAEKVELLSALLYVVIYTLNLGPVQKLVLAAGLVDLHKVLIYNSSGTEIHMADLRVSHLSVRKSDIFSASLEMAHRIFGAECVNEWCALSVDGIGVVVLALSPAVENHKKNFSVHIKMLLLFYSYICTAIKKYAFALQRYYFFSA